MTSPDLKSRQEGQIIPEFCRGRALGMLMIATQMVACILALASGATWSELPMRLLLLSLFLQWIGVSCAAVLCLTRHWLHASDVRWVFLVCWGLLVLVVFLVSVGAQAFLRYGHIDAAIHLIDADFVLRNVAIGALVSLLLLRYFWERHQWLEQTRAQSEARYASLQSRIHPHFLFNALNSLAALIRAKPEAAETMVEDLADLLRVSLADHYTLVTLREELGIVEVYLRIEQQRLGKRLTSNIDIPNDMMGLLIPRLTIQPLVENAVFHGIALLATPGTLQIHGWREPGFFCIEVTNPMPERSKSNKPGSGVAIANIRQRLHLLYREQASITLDAYTGPSRSNFRACLRFPLEQRANTSAILQQE